MQGETARGEAQRSGAYPSRRIPKHSSQPLASALTSGDEAAYGSRGDGGQHGLFVGEGVSLGSLVAIDIDPIEHENVHMGIDVQRRPESLHEGDGSATHFGNAANWLTLKLVGVRSNRDGIGARITIRAGDLSRVKEAKGSYSYLSQSDLRVSFGLGSRTRVDSIEIAWPGGDIERIRAVEANQFLAIVEGRGVAKTGEE